VPTYRVHYEVVRHTLYVKVDATSKNAAAQIARYIAERKLGIGKCEEVVILHVEQYLTHQPKQVQSAVS
jgi:hypothetical protein